MSRRRSRVTSRDIALEAGVSQSTVSRAMRGDRRVATATRHRILAVAERHAYTPNAAARTLITRRTHSLGVIVSDITNPFYPELVDVLHDEFALAGYRMVLFNDRGKRGEEHIIAQLQAHTVDGVVVTSATLASVLPERCAASGLPVVLLNRDAPAVEVDRVLSDNLVGGALAAEHLVALGHRRIGVISGRVDTSTTQDRISGFKATLAGHGLVVEDGLQRSGPYSHQSGYMAGLELLAMSPRPTALFCANDVVAFGALDAAKRIGLGVPRDLSVIGFDDIGMAAWEAFSLTTIRQPVVEMTKAAAHMLIERIEHDPVTPARRHVFQPSLAVRASTGPVAAA